MKTAPFSRYLPYWACRTVETTVGKADCLFLVDGTIVVGFSMTGADIYDAPNGQLNSIARGLRRALNALPANAFLQHDWKTGLFYDDLIDAYAARGAGSDGHPIFREQRRVRAQALSEDGSLRRGRHRLYVGLKEAFGKLAMPGTSPSIVDTISGLLSGVPPRLRDGLTRDDVIAAATPLIEAASRVKAELEGASIRCAPLSERDLLGDVFSALNPITAASVDPPVIIDEPLGDKALLSQPAFMVYRPLTVREQLPMGDMVWGEHDFTLDEPPIQHRVLSVQTLPPRTFAAGFSRVVQFITPTPFRLVTTLVAADTEKLKGALLRKRNIHQSFAQSGPRDIASETNVQEIERAVERIEQNDQRIFRASMQVVLMGASAAELDAATSEFKNEFSRRLNTMLTIESGRQRDAFLSTLPGNGLLTPRTFTVLTDNAADFIPYHEPSIGDPDPQLLYHTREGCLRKLSFNANRPNSNTLVIGGSGYGKSFNVAAIFEQAALAEGGPVYIIDVQGPKVSNYKTLAELFGGSYTALAGGADISFNPFVPLEDLYARDEQTAEFVRDANGKRILDDSRLGYLSKLVTMMGVRDIATTPQKDLYEQIAREVIMAAYKTVATSGKNRPPLLRDVVEELSRYKPRHPEMQPLARQMELQLETWVTHPSRSRLLDRPSTFSPTSNFVVFDFYGLEQDPDLASVLLLSVSFWLWSAMVKAGRAKTKLVIFDECWKLMTHPVAAELVVELYRTGRKWGISTWAITQTINDFASGGTSALIPNASNIILQKHNNDHEHVARLLDMNPRQLALFKDLRFKRGSYADFLLLEQAGDGTDNRKRVTTLVNVPTPFDYWINTTNAVDVGFRDRVERELKVSKLDAIRYCASQFPTGAPATLQTLPPFTALASSRAA
jgi:hypothetical protein